MIRESIALIASFILVFVESFIIMWIKQYQTIDYGGIRPFISVWAMNFFFVYSIVIQIEMWLDPKQNSSIE